MDPGTARRGRAGAVVVLQAALLLLLVRLGAVTSAPAEDLITALPGQPSVTFKQYGGFITVDAKNGRALYYYFVEAETIAFDRPLTLWLNGGQSALIVQQPRSNLVNLNQLKKIFYEDFHIFSLNLFFTFGFLF